MGRGGLEALSRRAGPFLLLPALFLFAYGVAWKLSQRPVVDDRLESRVSSAASYSSPEEVGGFGGALSVDDGRLSLRLVPLQSVEAWQAFDAAAIAQRLDLPAGEPWRLEIRFEADADAAPAELGDARIVDSVGEALTPIPGRSADDDGPIDPVRTLFGRRVETLAPGESVDLVLWGRAPGEAVRVVFGGDAERGTELIAARVPTAELARSIARADGEDGR